MGTNFSVESSSWAWNEYSESPTENLTTSDSSGVIFSVFGHTGWLHKTSFQGGMKFYASRSGVGTNFSVESSSWAWNEYSEKPTENLTTGDSSCVKFSVFGQF